MVYLIGLMVMAGFGDTSLKAHDLIYATEDHYKQVVGIRTSPPKEPGIRFAHPGYYEVWIDSPGPGMKHLRMGLSSMTGWKQYLSQLGLGVSHAAAHPMPVAPSPIPLFRNKVSVTGVTGLPVATNHKPWNVTFTEYAVANKVKLKALKTQIKSQPVGEARNALIRSCYDWWAEVDFTSP